MSNPAGTSAPPAKGWRWRPGIHTAFLPPEAVLLDDSSGDVHRLNGGAAAVWMLLDGQGSSEEIASELAEVFSLPVEAVTAEVEAALAEFDSRGFLDHGEPASSPSENVDVLPRPPDP